MLVLGVCSYRRCLRPSPESTHGGMQRRRTPIRLSDGKQTYHISFPTGIHVPPPLDRGRRLRGGKRALKSSALSSRITFLISSLRAREEGLQSQIRPLSISNLPLKRLPFSRPSTGSNPRTITCPRLERARAVARLPFQNRADDEMVTQDRDLENKTSHSRQPGWALLCSRVLPRLQESGFKRRTFRLPEWGLSTCTTASVSPYQI